MNQSCFYNTINIKLAGYRTTLSTIYSCTALTTVVLNAFVFYTIWKTSSLHRPSFILVANLALTDLLVGALGEPAMVVTHVAALNIWTDIFCYSWIVGRVVLYWLCSMSLLTLTAMGADRLLTVTLVDKYQEIVTVKRVVRVLIACWLFLGLLTTVAFLPINKVVVFVAIFIFVILVVLVISYIMAFDKLKKLSMKVNSFKDTQKKQRNSPLEILKYRRSLNTMLIVTITILLFFVPFLCCAITTAVIYATQPNYAKTLTYKLMTSGELIAIVNSAVNPFVYTWRMRELQRAVKKQTRKLFEKPNSQVIFLKTRTPRRDV